MPIIDIFFGITLRIYYRDHNPPHIHAEYQGFEAVFNLKGKMIAGKMPLKQKRLIAFWLKLNGEKIEANPFNHTR